MPHIVGQNHYVPFYGISTALGTSDFTVDVFFRDFGPVDDATRTSLSITEIVTGYYIATYIPTQPGFYYLGISNTPNNLHITEGVDIEEGESVVNLTQDTSGSSVLRPSLPKVKNSGLDLTEYLLMVFESSDWDVGRTDPMFAVASTELDAVGNWLATPLVVSPGTYHIVIQNNFGVVQVIKAHLVV